MYKRQGQDRRDPGVHEWPNQRNVVGLVREDIDVIGEVEGCLLYTSDAADERSSVDLGGRRIIKKKKNKYPNQYTPVLTNTIIQHIIRLQHK